MKKRVFTNTDNNLYDYIGHNYHQIDKYMKLYNYTLNNLSQIRELISSLSSGMVYWEDWFINGHNKITISSLIYVNQIR